MDFISPAEFSWTLTRAAGTPVPTPARRPTSTLSCQRHQAPRDPLPDRHPKATAHARSLESCFRPLRRTADRVDSQRPARLTTGPTRGDLWFRAPLLRFVRPFSASGWLRPLPHRLAGSGRGVACRFVPSSSFLRPRRFAPQSIPVRVSPDNTRGVRLTLQGFPPREGRSVSGATCPS